MTVTDQLSGVCDCGETVWRPAMRGAFAQMLNALPFVCEGCAGRREAEIDQELLERAAAEIRMRATTRLTAAAIPEGLQRVDLDALDPTGCEAAIAAGRVWAEDGGALLLTGPFGIGKTTIAAGALRLALTRRAGHWLSAPLLMARLGSGYGTAQRDLTLKVLTGRSALVLDDVDKTRPTEYGAEQIFLAVDGAVTNQRPLLVTTNLALGQLAAKWPEPYGEAIASRLVGYCTVIPLTGPDRRLQAKEATL